MNSAYMIRQMMEHYSSLHNVRGRITGLRYFREETAPDAWESRSLLSSAAGRDEAIEFTNMGGRSFYNKWGAPMKTTRSFNIILSVLQMFVGITAILGGFGLVSDHRSGFTTSDHT